MLGQQAAIFLTLSFWMVQGIVLVPLARRQGREGLATLVVLGLTSVVSSVFILLAFAPDTLSSFSFSPLSFLSGCLLAASFLLLLPAVAVLGLSCVVLQHLLSSCLHWGLIYLCGLYAVLGYEYDSSAGMHGSAFILNQIIGGSAVVCALIALSNRLHNTHMATRAGQTVGGHKEDGAEADELTASNAAQAWWPWRLLSSLIAAPAPRLDRQSCIQDETLRSSGGRDGYKDQQEMREEGKGRRKGQQRQQQQLAESFPSFSSVSPLKEREQQLSASSVSPLDSSLSLSRLSRFCVRLWLGFACCGLSALCHTLYLIPIYSTSRFGLLRLLPLSQFLLSLQLGLLCAVVAAVVVYSLCMHRLPRSSRSLVLPGLLSGAALASSSFFLLCFMPANASSSFTWFYYSQGSDAMAVVASTLPAATVTLAAFMLWKEHKAWEPRTEDDDDGQDAAVEVVEEAVGMMRAGGEEEQQQQEEQEEEEKLQAEPAAVVGAKAAADGNLQLVVSWSNVSLWLLALLLGGVAEGVAVYGWDEGY